MEYRKICNGIVIIKKFLSIEQQNELINKIINPIIDKKYFWKENGELNFMNLRGRHYCNLDDYEHNELLKNMSSRLMKIVQDIDITMPDCNPTHLLTLYYKTNRGIGWHKDNGSNDGDLDSPVISFTIGNSCIFEYKPYCWNTSESTINKQNKFNKTKYSVQLDSDDVIIFDGNRD